VAGVSLGLPSEKIAETPLSVADALLMKNGMITVVRKSSKVHRNGRHNTEKVNASHRLYQKGLSEKQPLTGLIT
jgi:hypothetical protein